MSLSEEQVRKLEQAALDKALAQKQVHNVRLVNPVVLKFDNGINHRGEWVAGTTYETGDGVLFEGGFYIAMNQTDARPDDLVNWQVIAEKGDQGERGEPGVDGKDGKDGEQGPKGERGERGPEGPRGLKGDTGAPGKPGERGEKGDTGERGPKGEKGAKGDKGADGVSIMGPQGPTGPAGVAGVGIAPGGTTGQVLAKASDDDYDTEWVAQSGGEGGGGAVDSVNGATGVVVLDSDDISDTGKTHRFTTASDISKLAGIAIGATANSPDATLLDRANHTGTQSASTISGLADVATSGDYTDLSNTPDLSVFDEVEQHANLAAFPGTGDSTKFYLAQDTGLMYRWTGATYTEISASLALGETSATAYRGDRGKTAYDHSQLTTGNPHNVTKTDVGLGNVDNTSDATKNAATATLTNKTISGSDNTITNIAQSSVTNLVSDLAGKASASHTHTASDVTDFNESVEDIIGAKVVAGTNVTVSYNDTTGETTIASTGGTGGVSLGAVHAYTAGIVML